MTQTFLSLADCCEHCQVFQVSRIGVGALCALILHTRCVCVRCLLSVGEEGSVLCAVTSWDAPATCAPTRQVSLTGGCGLLDTTCGPTRRSGALSESSCCHTAPSPIGTGLTCDLSLFAGSTVDCVCVEGGWQQMLMAEGLWCQSWRSNSHQESYRLLPSPLILLLETDEHTLPTPSPPLTAPLH